MPHYNTKSEVSKGQNIYRNQYAGTTQNFSATRHLLLVWGGSCYKLIWYQISVWLFCYTFLSVLYRNVLYNATNPRHRQMFEMICIYAEKFSGLVPITFITGFYVTQVVNRWWDQFMSLPWPDRLALKLVTNIPNGADGHGRILRRALMRYVNLSNVLVYRLVSRKVEVRFPDHQSLVDAKLMLPHEAERLKSEENKTPHESTWVPILWALKLLAKARNDKRIKLEAPIFGQIQSAFEDIERSNRKILNYGWINFPLAYTQVATFSVLLYFFSCLFGRQYLIPNELDMDTQSFPNLTDISFATKGPFKPHTPDFYVPFFTTFEIFAYYGWIKVAETLLNPFGDDDTDFQVNYLIDRNLQVSYMIVDNDDKEMDMIKDPFLEAGIDIPKDLPFQTPVTQRKRKESENKYNDEVITDEVNIEMTQGILSNNQIGDNNSSK